MGRKAWNTSKLNFGNSRIVSIVSNVSKIERSG